jgi:Protein of unknown function (DUF2975)
MDNTAALHRQSTSRGLRAFAGLLWVLTLVLAFVTAVAVPLLVLVVLGHGSITLDATIDPPYSVRFTGDRTIVVTGDQSVATFENFPVGDERHFIDTAPTVHAKANVVRDDTDSRAVVVVAFVALLALTWLALVNLRRVVRSARAGEPFTRKNVGRLRIVAITALALPAVSFVMTRILDSTLDVMIPLHVTIPGVSWWVFLVIGVGLLALAEVFREGAELQELEHATI